MKKTILHRIFLVIIAALGLTGCKVLTNKQDVNMILGTRAPETAAGEYLSHTVGGNAGAAINHYMDKQAKKLRKELKDGKVERIGEGILITFDSTATFSYGSTDLSAKLKENLKELADVVDHYEETDIIIEAHADSSGTSEGNLLLSEKRAKAVAAFAQSAGIDKYRMTTIGYGEDRPAEKKKSKQGLNRRVEIVIIANHELTVQGRKGDID